MEAVLRTLRRTAADERGVGIVTAVMVVFAVFAAAGTWATLAVHQVEGSSLERDRERAFAAAEAGLNDAMARLSFDAMNCQPFTGTLPGAEYRVEFDPSIDCTDPDVATRYIVARGFAPSEAAPRAARRQVEQQVELIPNDGFTHALFAAPGGITATNRMEVTGDVYSEEDFTLRNWSNVYGTITAMGSVTMDNNTLVAETVHSRGDIALLGAGATVGGDVLSAGGTKPDGTQWPANITVGGHVKGNAQAKGLVTVSGGTVDGQVASHSPPPAPRKQTLPLFHHDTLAYDRTWTSVSSFTTYWNAGDVSGVHRITDPTAFTLSKRIRLTGDTVIVTDGPLDLSRDIVNATSDDVVLALVSLSPSDWAVSMSNNLSLPSDIKILLFAPNGCAEFRNLKQFTGIVYAECIHMDNQFTLTYSPVELEAFEWTLTSAGRFTVESRTFREVPYTAG